MKTKYMLMTLVFAATAATNAVADDTSYREMALKQKACKLMAKMGETGFLAKKKGTLEKELPPESADESVMLVREAMLAGANKTNSDVADANMAAWALCMDKLAKR